MTLILFDIEQYGAKMCICHIKTEIISDMSNDNYGCHAKLDPSNYCQIEKRSKSAILN